MPTFKPTWTAAKDFIDQDTGVCVRVNKTNHQVPQYSFETGRLREVDDPKSFIQFLLVRVDRDDVTSGETDTDQIEALHDMLDEAVAWTKGEIFKAAEKFREKREKQDQDAAPVERPGPRENRGNRRRQSVQTETAPPSEPAPASVAA